jgi:23S rRNA pseudouridine1911/1915/1917 synthase
MAPSDSKQPLRYETVEYRVDPGQVALRIDLFLVGRLEKMSRSRIRQCADEGLLRVDGKPVKVNHKVKPGQVVRLDIPRFHEEVPMEAEAMDLDIRYEDDALLVLVKPAGLVVHPGSGNWSGTLVNGLMHHLPNTTTRALGEALDPERLGLVHRLDKDTSGLLVVAKTAVAAEHLSRQFAERSTERLYEAIAWGEFGEREGSIEGPIGRHPRQRQQYAVLEEGQGGKPALTHYRVLANLGYVAHLELKLQTGRTHQIRVHLAHIGHPLFGDATYGGDRIVKGTVFSKYRRFVENNLVTLPRQALHAKTLGFTHPETGERMRFAAEAPEDFRTVLERWERYAGLLKQGPSDSGEA